MAGTSGLDRISTQLCQVAEPARRRPKIVITTLAHHIDMDWMMEAHRRTRTDGAVGVDSVTAEAYAADLRTNLERLLERCKAGTYVAPPVRRANIPKGDSGKTRPIGIPTFEDKILQRAVAMVLDRYLVSRFMHSVRRVRCIRLTVLVLRRAPASCSRRRPPGPSRRRSRGANREPMWTSTSASPIVTAYWIG